MHPLIVNSNELNFGSKITNFSILKCSCLHAYKQRRLVSYTKKSCFSFSFNRIFVYLPLHCSKLLPYMKTMQSNTLKTRKNCKSKALTTANSMQQILKSKITFWDFFMKYLMSTQINFVYWLFFYFQSLFITTLNLTERTNGCLFWSSTIQSKIKQFYRKIHVFIQSWTLNPLTNSD